MIYLVLGKASLEGNMLDNGLEYAPPWSWSTPCLHKEINGHPASHFLIPTIKFGIGNIMQQGCQFNGQQIACSFLLPDIAGRFPYPFNVIPVMSSLGTGQGFLYKCNGVSLMILFITIQFRCDFS